MWKQPPITKGNTADLKRINNDRNKGTWGMMFSHCVLTSPAEEPVEVSTSARSDIGSHDDSDHVNE